MAINGTQRERLRVEGGDRIKIKGKRARQKMKEGGREGGGRVGRRKRGRDKSERRGVEG